MDKTKEGQVYIAFYKRNNKILDKLITFTSRGPYSHVELILLDSKHSISSSGRDNGTRYKRLKDMNFQDKKKWDIFELNTDGFNIDYKELEHLILKTKTTEDKHKGECNYDYLSVILFHLFRIPFLPKIKKESFICSEFVWECLEVLLKPIENNEVTEEFKKRHNEFNLGYKFTPTNVLTSLVAMGLIKRVVLEEVRWL